MAQSTGRFAFAWVLGAPAVCVLAFIALATMRCASDERPLRARTMLKTLSNAMELYRFRTGVLPSEAEGLAPLVRTGILRELPVDPWGHPYAFERSGSDGILVSWGADGQRGGEGDDADLRWPIPRAP